MAETLGSLIDKLAIKDLREFHIRKMLQEKDKRFSCKELQEQLKIVREQKGDLLAEIDLFISLAIRGKVKLREQKLKLYNKRAIIGKIGKLSGVAEGIAKLTEKNAELWALEDEARREDVDASFIGRIKRKIDVANQNRNDLMDAIDLLLEKAIKRHKE